MKHLACTLARSSNFNGNRQKKYLLNQRTVDETFCLHSSKVKLFPQQKTIHIYPTCGTIDETFSLSSRFTQLEKSR